jgi:iron complex outermembrane receptor protein
MFKRIEITKGSGAAIYGADAFAGIINLVSYNAQDAPATVTARSGEFGLLNSFNWDEHHLNFTMDYITSNDDPNRIITTDLQTTLDQIFGTSASHAPGPIDEHYEVMSLMAQWRWQQWSIDSKWIKDRARPITDTRQAIADYHRFNTRLSYNNLVPRLTVALIAKNLFNKDAREPSNGSIPQDYPLSGKQWLFKVRYDF